MAGESRDRVSRGGRQMVTQLLGVVRQRGERIRGRRGDPLVQRFGMARQGRGRRIGGSREASMKFAAMLLELSMKSCLTFVKKRRKSRRRVFE